MFSKDCPGCEALRNQVEYLQRQNMLLLEKLFPKPEERPEPDEKPIPIKTSKYIPWHVQRSMLEEEDRAKARILREKKEELDKVKIQDLEDEVLNATPIADSI